MERLCKFCKSNLADEFSDFCGPACARAFLEERPKRVCKSCGREFYMQKNQKSWLCSKCQYERRMEGLPKKKKNAEKTSTIDEIIDQQTKIRAETGKRLSYGQLMARKSAN